ncbi:CaiB/BaiF CoA transferase family protein [Sediminicoccus rosea]|uniref:CaiB/BaiF CoA-transferase family protein n=1 Tax=Sediminicoccus rosea TaxID=1225128 RepID=A0ABZ0PJ37_9PROT|nr:CaiB/BaiF CoA-transferase family protein [Sediminicoccus rosea]WPB85477.1 CaiB/BaiF CoA-transferase family protein [Sediminicoccus rosea]
MTISPLSALKVVEFTHMVMGPTTGMVLADLGADVVKVEPAPKGDSTRALTGSGTGFYASFQRNRRSLCVDMKAPEGLALVKKLVAQSDVLIENFRPGAMEKLGLGYAALSAENPRLIYCSCKGFLNGPYQHRTALDEVVQMMGGLAYMTGPEGQPLRAGASVIDIMGGLSAAIAILSVVTERAQTGRGRYVEAALFETVALLMAQHMAQTAITGTAPPPMSKRTPAWPVYDVFDTSDGGQVFVGVVTDTAWPAFCEAFGLTELAADPSLATKQQRVAQRARTIPVIAEALRHYTKPALMEKCEALGLPYAPIGKPADLFDDPHLTANGGLVPLTLPDGRSVKLPALPITLDGERPGLRHDLAPPGAQNDELCAELGYSPLEIGRLRDAGVIV